MNPMYMDQQHQPKSFLGDIQRLVFFAIGIMFIIPFVGLVFIFFTTSRDLETIQDQLKSATELSSTSMRSVSDELAQLVTKAEIKSVETVAIRVGILMDALKLNPQTVPDSQDLKRLLGENNMVLVSNLSDKVVIRPDALSAGTISEQYPLLDRLMSDEDYLSKVRKEQVGNIKVHRIYNSLDPATKGQIKNLTVLARIPSQKYSLGYTTRLTGSSGISALTSMEETQTQVTGSLNRAENTTSSLFLSNIIVFIAVIFIGLATSVLIYYLLMRRVGEPLKQLTETAEAIRHGYTDRRVNVVEMAGSMRNLGISINKMLDEITQLIQSDADRSRLQENIIDLLNVVSRVSEGDLTLRGRVTQDVLGSVVDGLNMMLDSQSKLIVQVKNAGLRVGQGANLILQTSRKIAADAKRQGEEIRHVTGIVIEASRSLQKVSISADLAVNQTGHSVNAAKRGATSVNQTVQSMQRIRNNVQSTAKTIKTLGDRSLEINAIVELINDISQRTNILSLNAAIEASKAGEQGKGFSIVADEIRKLAERTSNATKEISQFIEDIQIETNDAVLAMEEVTREVEQGWRQSDEAVVSLREIEESIDSAAARIKEISEQANLQVRRMHAVVDAIKSIHQVSRETAIGIYKTTYVTNTLRTPLETLNSTISQFHVLGTFELRTEADVDWHELEDMAEQQASRDFSYKTQEDRSLDYETVEEDAELASVPDEETITEDEENH